MKRYILFYFVGEKSAKGGNIRADFDLEDPLSGYFPEAKSASGYGPGVGQIREGPKFIGTLALK